MLIFPLPCEPRGVLGTYIHDLHNPCEPLEQSSGTLGAPAAPHEQKIGSAAAMRILWLFDSQLQLQPPVLLRHLTDAWFLFLMTEVPVQHDAATTPM